MKQYELINYGRSRLSDSGVPDSDIDADILWQYASGMNRTQMLLSRNEEVTDRKAACYTELIDRRCSREPLQYITGTQEFMGYEFDTAVGVLIPRQDTETLVDTALKLYRGCRVLDMCCGTGCIGISYGLLCGNCDVTLADISDSAVELTKRNVAKLCGDSRRFEVIKTNMFDNIHGEYDIILSNPPYIRSDVIDTLMPEVRDYEPRLALDGYSDGLYFYRIIIDKAREHIKDEGYVIFEIGNDQAEDVQLLFVDSGYDDIHVVKDLRRMDRVVYGRYKNQNHDKKRGI